MDTNWQFADELGPKRISYLNEPGAGLRAIVVVDNVACGPAIGGVRMAPDVTVEECFRLARAMTMKNAAAGLPHGGGKSVIAADPGMSRPDKERIVRAFARAIANERDYVPGPDMGTDELCMAWVLDEIGRAVGLPSEIGGIPLDEIGATGFGLAIAAEEAQVYCNMRLGGARAVIQGYGNVGRHAARFLGERGVKVIAVADLRGAIVNPDGIDVDALDAHKARTGWVRGFEGAAPLPAHDLIAVESEIFVPAARPDVITADNVDRLQASLILPGANIPATAEAERLLHERGVLMVPDFIANAGGVICATVEYHGGTRADAFAAIEEKIRANTAEVLERACETGRMPREVAVEIACERVRTAMGLRRFHA